MAYNKNPENRKLKYVFRMNEKEQLLFNENFSKSGLVSKADFIRKLLINLQVPCRLDKIKLLKFEVLAPALGRNNGLLKLYIFDFDDKDPRAREYKENRINEIIEDNEKLKEEIRKLVKDIKELIY